jgi:DHA2 family multidrug resistance protein
MSTTTTMDASIAAAEAAWKPRHNPWAVALTVTLATFMEVLDTSIANVALPHIAGGLGASQDEATWVLTSYLVSNAIILPVSAYLTTFIGRKKFYMICVLLFGLSSVLCGLAPSLPLLILFRVLQGAGGGGLQPSEQAILADTFPPAKRGQAFAMYGMAVVAAPAIGPTLGGWITDNYSWRWIFFINVPVAILSLYLTSRLVEDPPHIQRQVRENKRHGINMDFLGFGLLALGFGSLEFVMDKGQENDWLGSRVIVTFMILCAVSLLTLIFYEIGQIRRGKKPILDLTLFRNRTFATSFGFMFALGFILFGTTVLIPLFVQDLLGYTAEQAGLVISPGGLMIMALMPLVGYLISRVDPRYMIAYGFVISSTALALMHTLDLQVSYGYVALLRIFQASGLAFLFIPINTEAYNGVPREKNNDVSGLINLARNIGGSMGASFLVTMLARRAQYHQDRLVMHMTAQNPNFAASIGALKHYFQHQAGLTASSAQAKQMAYASLYGQLQRQAQLLSYLDVIAVLAVACSCLIPLCLLMKKPDAHGEIPVH